MKKYLLIVLLSLSLVGCMDANYEVITGTISHIDIVIEHDDDSSDKYLDIYVSGGNYRILYSKAREELLRVGNEITFKARVGKYYPKYFNNFDVLKDNNSKMRDILLEESKLLESSNK